METEKFKFREGSEGASEQKVIKGFKIGFSLGIILFIILMLTVPLLKENANQTSGFWKAVSWLSYIGVIAAMIFEEKITNSTGLSWLWGAICFVLLFAGLFLHGIGGV